MIKKNSWHCVVGREFWLIDMRSDQRFISKALSDVLSLFLSYKNQDMLTFGQQLFRRTNQSLGISFFFEKGVI